ncbi:FYN-binding protein 1 [Clinocottus analis]|uniref:FYN-binding protein 1 n=1 Tax=Clinocottus analis TaxID=304258 RepID=UPI0035C01F09
MDEQVDTLDFKALRAKFQKEDPLQRPTKIRPAPPEKPKTLPPPPPSQSPTSFLPAGARPSLLSSISQSLDRGSATAPRVVFKEDKKEGKKPLIQINAKGKDKSEGKPKKGKDKTKDGKEKPDGDSAEQKQKSGKEKKLPLFPEGAAELVPGAPAPQATLSKRKGFLGFKKSPKRNSAEVLSTESILDSPSLNGPEPAMIPAPLIPAPLVPAPLIPAPLIPAPLIPAPLVPAPLIPAPLIPAPLIPAPLSPAPLIPAPSDFGDAEPAEPSVLLPNIPTFPDYTAAEEVIPAFPEFTVLPTFVPDAPAPEAPTPEIETLEIETPSLPVSRPASRNEAIPDPPAAAPTPPPSRFVSATPPVASTPSPTPPELAVEEEEEASAEEVNIAEVEAPPPAAADPDSKTPSPKAERPTSAMAALSRVEILNQGKRTALDQRIFNALEKARRKSSPQTNPSSSYSVTPPPGEFTPSPTPSLIDLPPIDYSGDAARPSKPVNGFDHRQASAGLEGIAEERSGAIPELMVVAPPPPKRVLPDPESLGPTPEKPSRPLSVQMGHFIPPTPPVVDDGIIAPLKLSEDLPEFESERGNDTSNEQSMSELYSNDTTPPGAEVPSDREPEPYFPISLGPTGLEGVVDNGIYESNEDAYEVVPTAATKKKGKGDGGKKRKGTLKNPYAEPQQETVKIFNEEKVKTGRFGKNDKKAEGPDEKELKKKEKQRLEKEKKELKEKQEREKKEQKEREKKENEMKKKFQITGQEDAMYQATVTVSNKGRKNDLPVNSGDVVSIIRTTNCPKGKWLARDSGNNCGYIAVDHVELDIKEMLQLGKKAASDRKGSSNNAVEEVDARTGNRVSNHFPTSAESFTDDTDEEWAADDEDPLTPATETENPLVSTGHNRTLSMPDIGKKLFVCQIYADCSLRVQYSFTIIYLQSLSVKGNKDLSVNHSHSRSDISADGPNVHARHEALHKLATFFHTPKPEKPAASRPEPETSPVLVKEEEVPFHAEPETSPVLVKEEDNPLQAAASTQEVDLDITDLIILPPPDLYADFSVE